MRNVLNHQDPIRPVVVRESVMAVARLKGRGDQLPDVTSDKEPNNQDRYSCQTTFLVSIVGAVKHDARTTRDAAADTTDTRSARARRLQRSSEKRII